MSNFLSKYVKREVSTKTSNTFIIVFRLTFNLIVFDNILKLIKVKIIEEIIQDMSLNKTMDRLLV